MHPILKALGDHGPSTVKDLAGHTGLSESRIRELLKKFPDLKSEKGGTAPAVYSLPDPVEARGTQAEPAKVTCPLCGSEAEQTSAGEEGSFLGACRTCSDCGKTYNAITGKELVDNPAENGKRKPLNPQYKIVAKTEALEAAGGKLTFDKASRQWIVTKADGAIFRLTAKQFSELTPETIVAYNG